MPGDRRADEASVPPQAVMSRIALPLAVVVVLACLAMMVFSVASLFLPGTELMPNRPGIADFLAIMAIVLAFPFVGLVIAWKRPTNPVGWLFLVTGLTMALNVFSAEYSDRVAFAGDLLPGGALLAWLAPQWFLGPGVALPLAIALFPDGRLPASRWRPALTISIALSLVVTAVGSFAPGDLRGYEGVFVNPFGWPGRLGELAAWTSEVGGVLQFPPAIIAICYTAVRLRRARGAERQQLKWLLFPLALFVGTIATAIAVAWTQPALAEDVRWMFTVALAALAAVPFSAGIAVLRYRLFDIDLVINRAVLYGGATALILAIFGIANVGLQSALAIWTGGHSELLTGFLGLAIGSQYGRLRRGVRPLVDRFLPSRAVLTLLFTDIVGSTERLVEMGDERWRNLLGRYRATVRQELARFGGHEVDTAGDAFFATFNRAASAVRCAWAIRSAVSAIGLPLRTGLHLGECELRGEKVSGLEVHAAARVMAAAGDGEILLSAAVQDAIRGEQIEMLDRGTRTLKGVPGEWRLYALARLRTAGDSAGRDS